MLQTNVGEVTLNTPLLLASGYITETPEFFLKTSGCSGMVTRSLKENPPSERKNVPAPRYVVFDDGKSMLNCEWGNSIPWTEWYRHGVADVKNAGGSLILSISGRVIADCSSMIKKFDEINIDAFEINISCSHSGAVHGNLNIDIEHLKELLTKVRPLTQKPIWVKLSYSSYLLDMAKIAEKLGADAIVCSNSIGPGLFIDTETGLPKLGIKGGAGGVTGKAIFPIALNCVYQLAQTVELPIVGIGGISTANDVIQMMMAGASAVQLYTAPAISGPEVFQGIVDDLTNYLTMHKIDTIRDLVGITIGKAESNCFKAPKPTVFGKDCIHCGLCTKACVFDAIEQPLITINYDKCVGCNACVGVCPAGALTTYYERGE